MAKQRDRIRNIWNKMKGRCYNETWPAYKNYGAKGERKHHLNWKFGFIK